MADELTVEACWMRASCTFSSMLVMRFGFGLCAFSSIFSMLVGRCSRIIGIVCGGANKLHTNGRTITAQGAVACSSPVSLAVREY